jgi:putative hydrolase of the HAD superfamily
MSRVKTLWVREPYLAEILAGRKTVEVRVGYENIRRLEPGDRLRLNDQQEVTIRRIGRYADFEEMLAHEDAAAIAPDLPAGDLLPVLRRLYPPEKEALGAVALELDVPDVPSPDRGAPEPSGSGDPAPGGRARRYDAILFDMGYTLVYFEPAQPLIIQEALRAAGVERTPDEIRAAVDTTWDRYYHDAAHVTFPATEEYDAHAQRELSRTLLLQLGVTGEPALQTYLQVLESWFDRLGFVQPYPEVPGVLDWLAAEGYRLGIVSNWSWNLRRRVAQAGLDGRFELVWASAYAGCNKPHPGIFEQALAHLALPAGRVLYVGDSYRHDVLGARAAGVDAVLLDRAGTAAAVDCPTIGDLGGLVPLLSGAHD